MIRRSIPLALLGLWALALGSLNFSRAQKKEHPSSQGNIQITLTQKFIDAYKDRVTITADDFVIDMAHKEPNPPSKDGDLHVAGRAKSIGLPIVAEIMNAKFQKGAVQRVHALEGTDKELIVTGAWRLWCEHAFSSKQVQGDPLQPFKTTNPPHVFEIHPITKLDGIDVTSSFRPIKGFQTKDAHDAFVTYENIRCEIRPNKDKTVTLVTGMAGYNYVEFILELNEDPGELEDGYETFCKVRDLEGELLVHNRRILFVKDTEPANQVKVLKKGKRMHVLGLPRIDLALVDWRVKNANDEKWKDEKPLLWNLPYEIVVVAVYPAAVNGGND
jgi:hypothetical protein